MHNILVVDDELSIRDAFSLILGDKYNLSLAASGEAALKIVASQPIEMAFLDVRMTGLNGLETLARIKKIAPQIEVIMVTAVNDIQKASEAIKLGAYDYVIKPFDVSQILKITEQVLRKKNILNDKLAVQSNIYKKPAQLIGHSEKMLTLLKSIETIKPQEHVLILGEPGTEKQLLAQFIHEQQKPSTPFLSQSLCGSLSAQSIKAIFCGLEKGSHTDELKTQTGLFEEARNGTIFIDHIEYLPEEVVNLIASGNFCRMGGAALLPVDTRIIAGSTLEETNKEKHWSEFFKAVIKLPPLRQRIADFPLLFDHLLEKYQALYQREIKLHPSTVHILTNYSWPGNLSELDRLVERLFFCPNPEIMPADLPLDFLLKTGERFTFNLLQNFEQQYIATILEMHKNDKEITAETLGISLNVLEAKL